MNKKPPVICLMGPTAVGKTDLAIQLAQQFPVTIISVDSTMVYQRMNIGTGKPSQQILAEIPHYLVNNCQLPESYSAARFISDASKYIQQIIDNGKIPLLVGGTMLYFHALQFGLNQLPAADEQLRAKLTQQAEQLGWPKMHAKLKQIDPQQAQKIHPNDQQRIARALEVYYLSGTKLSAWLANSPNGLANYNFYNWLVSPQNRAELHQKITNRFHRMLADGLLDEVRALYDMLDTPAMKAVGYRQVVEYLQGKIDHQTMIERAIIATRQLAKRQLTWLRKWQSAWWLDSNDSSYQIQLKTKLTKLVAEHI